MATKCRHFGSGLFKPGACDGAGRMVVTAVLLCACICARGETVTEEPDAFLEYIEATGENGGKQYIDTGVNAETGLKAQIDFAWASGDISGKDWSFLDATINNTDSNKRTRFLMCHMCNKKPFFGYGKQCGNPSGAVDFVGGERCEIITDMTDPDSLELYQNGVKTFSEEDLETFRTNGVVNLHLNLFVFACNLSGVPKWYSQGKLYELKIWKNNLESGELELIRHYLPCKKGRRAGLYDKVHGTISFSYSNEDNSNKDFIAGPELVAVPAYLEGADGQMKAKYNAWAATYGPDTTGEHEAAFLLNVAQTATPVELRIVDVEVVEDGARIRVAAEAGGDDVDLSHANGVIYVAAGDTVTNLVERTVQGTTFSGDGKNATITVPSAAGTFVKVVVGVSAPSEP